MWKDDMRDAVRWSILLLTLLSTRTKIEPTCPDAMMVHLHDAAVALGMRLDTTLVGSRKRTYRLHVLQWCALGGLYISHFRHQRCCSGSRAASEALPLS